MAIYENLNKVIPIKATYIDSNVYGVFRSKWLDDETNTVGIFDNLLSHFIQFLNKS